MPRGQYDRSKIAQSERPELVPAESAALSPRAAEMRRERRRRDDGNLDRMAHSALTIPTTVRERLNSEGKVARWVMDSPGRQMQMHADDWDVAADMEPIAADRHSGERLVLMEKYRDWYEADQTADAQSLDEKENALKRGRKIDPDDRRQDDVSYVPAGNSFSRKPGL